MMTGHSYYACCGKTICTGCVHAFQSMGNVTICPFCRTPMSTTDEETLEMNNKRIKAEDASAFFQLGSYYQAGLFGLPQDSDKARDFYLRAGKLGSAKAYCNIGIECFSDSGAGRDEKKALYYWELAAIGGCEKARYNIGIMEARAGNITRALKHFMIAAECGETESLDKIRKFYSNGHATKHDYTKALKYRQAYVSEVKSNQREAAALNEGYYYY